MDVYRFNWAARKLRKRLCQLGADETYQYGEADQQHPEGFGYLSLISEFF